MHRTARLVRGIVSLMLVVGVSRSWGGPPNNDVSDALGNTEGTGNTACGSGRCCRTAWASLMPRWVPAR